MVNVTRQQAYPCEGALDYELAISIGHAREQIFQGSEHLAVIFGLGRGYRLGISAEDGASRLRAAVE